MRIGVYLGNYIAPEEGGAAVFQNEVIEELIKQNKSHELYIYYFGKTKLKSNSPKVIFVQIPSKSLKRFIKRILTFFSDKKSFHLYGAKESYSFLNDFFIRDRIKFAYFPTPIYFEETEVPFIFTMWDLGDKVHPYFPETSMRKREFEKRRFRYSKILPKASFVFIGNDSGKNQLAKYYAIDENKVVINPMLTPSYITKIDSDDSVLLKFNLEKNKYLFYPAQFWPHKNHIRLIYAMKELSKEGYKLVLTGTDKGNTNFIKDKVKEYNLEDSIIFTGFVSQEELVALYKNAFAMTYASIMGPDNIPPLEAFALDCPVICAKYDGAEEQLHDAALYFDPYNENEIVSAVKRLADDVLREQLIHRGEELAKNYCVENYIQTVLGTLNKASKIRECWE